MRILCRCLAQKPDLVELERRPLSPGVEQGPCVGDRHIRARRLVAHESSGPPCPDGPFFRIARAIFTYRIFPAWMVTGVLRRVPVQPGDTFGNLFHAFPGVDLFFGGRIAARFDGQHDGVWRTGFSFRTILGHPMIGEETFWVEKNAVTGAVAAGLESWSRPGSWLTRVGVILLQQVQTRPPRPP